MNTDSESFQGDFMAWLFEDVEHVIPLAPIRGESTSNATSDFRESADFSPQSGTEPFRTGEIPIVQDRFQAIIKRRLQAEIERHPPLFPWEEEMMDYETDGATIAAAPALPNLLWTAQLRNLNLPVPMPEKVLARLLEQCQQVVQSSLLEGTRLVQAVDALFPGHTRELNHLAGLVLMGATRSGATATSRVKFPAHYEVASEPQQMVLSLLAAKQIIESLTLNVSVNQPVLEYQWLTGAGLLTLETKYQPQGSSRLRVQGRTPCGASLKFQSPAMQSAASRPTAGCLSVELFDPKPNQSYSLEVRLQDAPQQPMVFAIRPMI